MASISESQKSTLAQALFSSNLLKFGSFTLKSGLVSPIYIDLRQAQSYPETFHAIVETFSQMIAEDSKGTFIAGVPEAATPFAAALGYSQMRPLLQPRKVVKDHGTKSSVEGAFKPGDEIILVDDLITKGDSKLEAIEQVETAGLKVAKFIVLVDREQGGVEMLRDKGYTIEAAMSITSLLDTLLAEGSLDQAKYDEVVAFIRAN